jgi:hypothetical protein
MLGAMYENGGNVTHRFLDNHPEMFVYPFESQVGTSLVHDRLSSMFPLKYRWPEFSLEGTPLQDYRAIIDEECKIRSRTPFVSKFRDSAMDFSDDERCLIYQDIIAKTGRSRANNVAAFFQATFEAWKDYKRTGKEKAYVGYSPIIVVDAEKILNDLPNAHFLHVVRNPWSAYADTKKRPVPLPLKDYMLGWCLNQYFAFTLKAKFADRLHIVRTEDTLADPVATLGPVCAAMGLQQAETLKTMSWNGTALAEAYPWGTLRKATPEVNLATARELSEAERGEIRELVWQYLDILDYRAFLKQL